MIRPPRLLPKPLMPMLLVPMLLALLLAACQKPAATSDAYGNFEATRVRVAAELPGRLLELGVDEGQALTAGQVVGRVEAVGLDLERAQLVASRGATASRTASIDAQIAVLAVQKKLATSELARLERLAAAEAATRQQLDRATAELAVLEKQIRQSETQRATVALDLATLDAQLARLDDRRGRDTIKNPLAGTVLTVFAEPSELVTTGQPLYEIADLSALELKAFASGALLPRLALGQEVEVLIDEDATTNRSLRGTISWIASQAEFTPSTLQTKEERVELVYAFKVRVPNPEGRIKIGMPGEVRLSATSSTPGT
jgi:HlyD family secretion protein